MIKKASPLTFQPAPRPQARLSDEDAVRLAEASADLGFTRPISAPEPQAPAARSKPDTPPASASLTPAGFEAAPRPRLRRQANKPAPTEVIDHTSLKIDVPDAVWTSLKLEAVRRRVTVKFLVLEALARQGYEIDLDKVPEDGRRLR